MYDRGILGRISEPLNFIKFLCIVCSYFSCLCFILDIFSWYRCQLHCMLLPYAKKKIIITIRPHFLLRSQ